ncbi:MAG: ferritin family protein [Deltaproteobacteria bacterium]|nr:ferritin family protein [Deltaproteobacteria bacterium]
MTERLNALAIALENEMKEKKFYLENADRTKHPLGKAMFQQIATEEDEHYQRLKELHEKWEKQQKWPDSLPLRVKDTVVKNVLNGMLKKVSEMPMGDDDDLKAIRTAIKFEARGAEFYARLRDNSTAPKEKAFFNLLADIEHEHYVSLKDTEEYLTDPASWFQKQEKSGLDGA